MLSFLLLVALANLPLELKSCHDFLPVSSSFVARIFLAFGFASAPSNALCSAASRLFFAKSGSMLAAAEMTPGALGGGGGGACDGYDDDGGP